MGVSVSGLELAEITIFDFAKKSGVWRGKLFPTGLNSSMDWSENYFNNLKVCFREKPIDVEFSATLVENED